LAFGARRFPFPALAAMSAFPAFPGEVIGRVCRRRFSAATVLFWSLTFAAKAVERSDSCDGPKGAVATARHQHVHAFRANDAKATACWSGCERVAPLQPLSITARSASRDQTSSPCSGCQPGSFRTMSDKLVAATGRCARSPITNKQSPITDYRLPITDYRLPITDH
jgi:hypothetical protein